jgi:hypothetical protein
MAAWGQQQPFASLPLDRLVPARSRRSDLASAPATLRVNVNHFCTWGIEEMI